MSVFLSVEGSLTYWRSSDPYYLNELNVAPAFDAVFASCTNSLRDISRYRSIRFIDSPLEVLVSSQAELRRNDHIATRLITQALPKGSFYEIEKDVYACSPELTFLLAAAKIPLRSLIALGCELCGTYSTFSAAHTAQKHAQVTDITTIRSYLDQVPGMHGIKLARQALSCIADGSASPRETDVYMQFCMRPKLGSYGFCNVELNHTFDLNDYPRARSITNIDRITPDLYWAKHKIAIEYESTENHGAYASNRDLLSINRRKLSSDSIRRRTYNAMKISVFTVTDGEFCSFDEVERIAKLLARHMKKYDIKHDLESRYRRSQLHDWLKIPYENRNDVL